jgi:DUF1680 family protein
MDGVREADIHEIGFQFRRGSPELKCCSVNAARGLGLIAKWVVMRDADGLFLNWYGPGAITAKLKSGGVIKRVQETQYPVSGAVRVAVEPEQPCAFALRLRIPHWSTQTTVRVDGEPISNVAPGRYLSLSRGWKRGDSVELGLDMSPRYWAGERESAGLTSIYHGPILMSYDRRCNTIDAADLHLWTRRISRAPRQSVRRDRYPQFS